MKFTWLSNAPWAPTGYGNQTKVFLPRLMADGHEAAVIALYGHEGTPINWNGILVYPRAQNAWGNDVMDAHTVHFGAQVCISLIDAWVINPEQFISGTKWVPWFPVDHDPLPPVVADKVSKAYRRIVFSKSAQRAVENAGMDCYYVPHGVDTKVFLPRDKAECRKLIGWSDDRYYVGMVAANKGTPSRKAFQQQLEAFALFKRKRPEAALYLHTSKGEHGEHQGMNLVELLDHLGLTWTVMGRTNTDANADVLFCDQYIYLLGFPDEYMTAMYSALDVHMLVSMGEGFGIPTLEAQACGTPVITSGWTASEELCFSGIKVHDKKADRWWTPLASWQWIPRVGAILSALEAMYKNPRSREKAREGALAYDADLITAEYWRPVLAEIAQDIEMWQGEISNGGPLPAGIPVSARSEQPVSDSRG